MNVPFQVKLPVKTAMALEEKLRDLRAAHEKRVALITKKIEAGGSTPAKLRQELSIVERQGRLLTINNLIRLAASHGVGVLSTLKEDQVFKHLNDDGIARGRPRAA